MNIISVTNFHAISLKHTVWGFCFLIAQEFIHYIADAIQVKVVAIIASKQFMAMLSDRSQARKTSNEKELVLVWVEKNGTPVYFVVALLEMADFGGTDAISLKKGVDSLFESGNVPCWITKQS